MAVTAGTGGTGTVDATGDFIFSPTGPRASNCTSIRVTCAAASAQALQVRVIRLHDSDAYAYLEIGACDIYRLGEMEIQQVHCKSATGTATVNWAVVARTGASAM